MADKTIKTRLVLEGEQQYRQAMRNSASAVKALNAEEKAAAAQFKSTGDREAYVAEQTRILNEKLEEQRKAVEAAQEVVKKYTEKGVDKNDRDMQKWRTSLANAQAQMATTQAKLNELTGGIETVGAAMDDGGQAAADYSAQLDQIGGVINVEGAIHSIDRITDAAKSAVTTLAGMGKKVWQLEADAASWADDALTRATQAGVDVETWQAWQFAAEKVDVSAEDIMSATDRMNGKLLKENDAAVKSLNKLGVRITDTAGNARDGSDIFWDTVDALHGMTDITERNNRAQQIFGNQYRQILPLIESGREKWDSATRDARENYILSEDQVNQLADANDAFENLGYAAEKTKKSLLSELAPAFIEVAGALEKALTAFNEFLQTPEGQQMMAEFRGALVDLVHVFTGGEDGNPFASLVETAKTAVEKFTGALKWLSDNKDLVAGAIKGLGAAFLALSMSKGVLTLLQLFNAGKTFLGIGGKKTLPTGTPTTPTAPTTPTGTPTAPAAKPTTPTTTPNYRPWHPVDYGNNARIAAEEAARWGTGATGGGGSVAYGTLHTTLGGLTLPGILGGTALSALAFWGLTQLATSGNTQINQVFDPHRYDKADDAEVIQTAVRGILGANPSSSQWQMNWMAANLGPERFFEAFNFEDAQRGASNWLVDVLGGHDSQTAAAIWEIWERNYGRQGTARGDEAWARLTPEQQAALTMGQNAYLNMRASGGQLDYTALHTGMRQFFGNTGTFNAEGLWTIPGLSEGAKTEGENFGEGYAEGMEAKEERVNSAAMSLAEDGIESVREANDSHSPSRVAIGLGQDFGEGYAMGMLQEYGRVYSAAASLAMGAVLAFRQALDIHSPSGVMAEMGLHTGEGYAEGIDRSTALVAAAADRMTGVMRDRVSAGASAAALTGGSLRQTAAGGGRDSADGSGVNAVIYMDRRAVGYMVADTVNEVMGAKVSASRRDDD